MQQFVVVSYDIPDDRKRRKVMKTLEGFGRRVQYSVFECRLAEKHLADLRRRLKKLTGRQDSVRFYFIAADDVGRIEVLGHGQITQDRPFYLR